MDLRSLWEAVEGRGIKGKAYAGFFSSQIGTRCRKGNGKSVAGYS